MIEIFLNNRVFLW